MHPRAQAECAAALDIDERDVDDLHSQGNLLPLLLARMLKELRRTHARPIADSGTALLEALAREWGCSKAFTCEALVHWAEQGATPGARDALAALRAYLRLGDGADLSPQRLGANLVQLKRDTANRPLRLETERQGRSGAVWIVRDSRG